MKTFLCRSICRLLIAVLALVSYSVPTQAALIATDQVVARERVHGLLARSDVQRQLVLQGRSPAAARDRVDSLSDDEVRQLAGQIDALPAGGDGGVALLLIVLLVVLLVLLLDRRHR